MSAELVKPYIGVTGISTPIEARYLSQSFETYLPTSHLGMVGVLVSNKTMAGGIDNPEKYPAFDTIPAIFKETRAVALNMIHFRTKSPESLVQDIAMLFDSNHLYDSQLCNSVQLNMRWPNPKDLEAIKKILPDLGIILQIGSRALKDVTRMDMLNHLRRYQGLANYVLLDPSGGLGRPFDTDYLVPYFQTTRHALPNSPTIFAGGFNDTNVTPRLVQIYNRVQTTDFGIDAEGSLRVNKGPKVHGGTLSLEKVDSYVKNAGAFFGALNQPAL